MRDPEHRRGEVERNRRSAMGDEIGGDVRGPAAEIEDWAVLRALLGQDIEDAAVELELAKVIAERRGVLAGDSRVCSADDLTIEAGICHTLRLPHNAMVGERRAAVV